MKNRIFSDYSRINVSTKRGRQAFMGALQHYYGKSQEVQDQLISAGIREFTSSANFPASVLDIVDKFHVDVAEIDTAYEAAFSTIDLTNVQTSSFTVRDSQSGLSFRKVRDGEKAKVYSIHGAEVTVSMNLYGGALQWLKTWFDDGEWWTIEDNALEFRRKWFEEKATAFYDMIQSLTSSVVFNTPYDATAGLTTVLDFDRMTINTAAANLIGTLRDSGFGVTAGTPLVMLVPLTHKTRVEAALNPSATQYVSGVGMTYNITPYYTSYIDWDGQGGIGGTLFTGDTGRAVPLGYLTVPGRKNKIGNRMNLTLLAETDILAFAETVVGWGRYGAYMNEEQWRRVSAIL